MFSRIKSAVIFGLKPYLIDVEVDISQGLPCFVMVGSLSNEVKESAERVRIALKNMGISLPAMHIAVNLSPADIKKGGTGFDLPIAVGVLMTMGIINKEALSDALVLGEIGLNGEIKKINGVMPMVWEAKKNGIKSCFVPSENADEAAIIKETRVIGIDTLSKLIEYLKEDPDKRDELIKPAQYKEAAFLAGREHAYDFSDITGQEGLKRGALIAAAGFHHMLIMGPPGTGKTMIAKRLPSILPPLSKDERMDVTAIYSIAGKLTPKEPLIKERPFLNPHHGISPNALAGGGSVPGPGILSLANKGVLFLDELPEFSRQTLDMLREPLEEKRISISRVAGAFTYPADIMLVCAMNPCPCGYYPDMNKCRCTPWTVKQYLGRISGPVLDRMDLCLTADRVKIKDLQKKKNGVSSADMLKKVMEARGQQEERYRGTEYKFNSSLDIRGIEKYCELGNEEKELIRNICGKLDISARAYHRLLKVSRTIADIEGSESIKSSHIAEAVCYRPQLPAV